MNWEQAHSRPTGLPVACVCLAALALSPTQAQAPAGAVQRAVGSGGTVKRVAVPQATRVDLGHLGVHTHANFITFDTGAVNVAAMQKDTRRFRDVVIVGHSRLGTDHAALPPDLRGLAQSYGPIPNPYGPIDGRLYGKPGWSAVAYQAGQRHGVKISVPTRFANWVMQQPRKQQLRYLDRRSYSLTITWQEAGAAD